METSKVSWWVIEQHQRDAIQELLMTLNPNLTEDQLDKLIVLFYHLTIWDNNSDANRVEQRS